MLARIAGTFNFLFWKNSAAFEKITTARFAEQSPVSPVSS
jgi:hypothetical protein